MKSDALMKMHYENYNLTNEYIIYYLIMFVVCITVYSVFLV